MHALSLKDLNKTYANGLVALRDVSLDVEAGDFYALLGPNGAGKSTTIGIISSLVNKTAGRVRVFGHDIDREPEAVKACLGLVPQEINFNNFEKCRHILMNQAGFYGLPYERARQRTDACLRQLGLWAKRDDIARNLSGGMKRRLMIARALVHEPRLLILDEPTAGVDIEIRRSMWTFLREINAEGTTIILTTHYLEEAESLCRNIGIIDRGEIVEDTSMKELLRRLDTETYVLYLDGRVEDLPPLPGYAVEAVDENTVELSVHRGQGLTEAFRRLREAGFEVLSMRNKANRLEQLFMSLVSSTHEPPVSTVSERRAPV
ncbi:MAG TPA: ABC transporter ATP-binding protein [Gammaproteobacteria bacterium]|nr:ABC transporter ATP-binding protein [Gammaproteobacteria bacterium]